VLEPLKKEVKRDRPRPLTDSAVAALTAHRKLQALERMASSTWAEQPAEGQLIFTSLGKGGVHGGTWVDPTNFSHLIAAASTRAGVQRITSHGLRHTMASLLFADKVAIEIISELLGHSNTRVTSEVYVHLTGPSLRAASDTLNRALGG
jgi:integrase